MTLRPLVLALLLPVAALAAPSTNRVDLAFAEARMSEVAELLTEKADLKLIVPSQFADVPVSLRLRQASGEDALAALNVFMSCSQAEIAWKETKLSGDQRAFTLGEGRPAIQGRPLTDGIRGLKAMGRVTIDLKQARLADAVAFLDKLTGGSLAMVYGSGLAELTVDLKLHDVTPPDALIALNELLHASGVEAAWQTVTLPSGREVFALLPRPETRAAAGAEPEADEETTARVYYIGDLGANLRETADPICELVALNAHKAEVSLHEGTRMLVVRATEADHAFVKNVVEELRRGLSGKTSAPEAKP